MKESTQSSFRRAVNKALSLIGKETDQVIYAYLSHGDVILFDVCHERVLDIDDIVWLYIEPGCFQDLDHVDAIFDTYYYNALAEVHSMIGAEL